LVILKEDAPLEASSKRRGTKVIFIPDSKIFKNYKYRLEYVERMIKNYVYLNPGLTIDLNGENIFLKTA
jgi:topoisomerase-4 subunit B